VTTSEIKDKLANIRYAIIPGTNNACRAAYNSIKSSLTYFFEEKKSGTCLTAGIVTQDVVRIEGLRFVNYRAVWWLGNSMDGTCIDKAADTGCTTGCSHITHTTHIYPLKHLLHAGHDGNNTGQVKDDISTDKCRFKTLEVGDVTTDNLYFEASQRTTVVIVHDKSTYDLPTCD
jgi:hypothetical protein